MNPKIVFSDFDGTLTLGQSLTAHFFEILDLLKKHNIELVMVSGRSLSWGHFLMTHFPLAAAIMEGGGVIVTPDQFYEFEEEFLVGEKERKQINDVANQVAKKFPEIGLTRDSQGRVVDRAIPLSALNAHPKSEELKKAIFRFLEEKRAHFSISSVHINFWCGDVSKAKGINHFLKTHRSKVKPEECLYFGDAPNDEEAFAFFPNSIGVANIAPYLGRMKTKPKVVLQGKDKEGPLGVLSYLREVLK